MERKGSKFGRSIGLLFWAAWMLVPSATTANLKLQKKAKELGFPVETCLYCHNEKPKEGRSHAQRSGQVADRGEGEARASS